MSTADGHSHVDRAARSLPRRWSVSGGDADTWTSNRRSRFTRAASSKRLGAVIALLTCFGLAACTVTATTTPASTSETQAVAPFPQSGPIDAGTYLVSGYPVPFEITVPDGWETVDGANLLKDDSEHPGEGAVFLVFWPAVYVPTDACAWHGALVKVERTPEAFVEAMTAQTSTRSTPPVEVEVGDYSGLEFDHAVEGDVEMTGCDGRKFCVHSDQAQACGRWYSDQGERETYRVVDLNGERAVIAVGQFHESVDPALTAEARAVFDSIVFVSPD